MKREISPAQIKAVSKYEANNYDKILVRIPKGKREEYKQAAIKAGYKSLNAFIVQAIEKELSTK